MQLRSRTQLAWLLFLSTLGCLAGGLVVTLFVTRPLTAQVLLQGGGDAVPWLLFATIGLVLTLRRPANPIGWLYAAAALTWTASIPWDPWLDRLLRTGHPLPLAASVAALGGDTLWRLASPLPSPCRCCCCPTAGCARAAGGWSWPPPWPGRPWTWSGGPWRRRH